MKNTLLIDTDILLYRSASSAEQEICWGGDIWSLFTDLGEAKAAFAHQVDKICTALKSNDVLFCLSDHNGNFRRQVDETYKSNRKGTRKPVGYVALCDWVKETYKSISKPLLEADDVMSIISTKYKGDCIIVSDDKDMKSCPSRLYRPTAQEMLDISEEQADAFFYQQCLQGDPVDNIKGLKGVGEKTALKILGNRPTWKLVEQAYIKAGLTRDDAIQQARLVRILRYEDWDDQKQEVKLWQPTT